RSLVDRYFGDIPAGPPVPPIPGVLELPPVLGEEKRQLVEQDISLPRTFIAFRIPPYGDDRFYTADVAATILGTGKASLLNRTLVLKNRTAQDVAAFAFPVVVGAAILVLMATAAEGVDIERVEADALSCVDALRAVSDEDVERAVNLIA